MNRCTTPRRHATRSTAWFYALVQHGVVASCIAFAFSCGASRVPASLRGYDILVERQDPQGVELERAMRSYGFRVRQAVRGGSRRTAALIFFIFRDPGNAPGAPPGLHVRLADTRTGAIVGAGMVPLDSVGPSPRARADAVVRALLARPVPPPP